MSDKPTEDQPTEGERNRQAPETPSIGQSEEPTGNAPKKPGSEKASDREGQTREPGYDEA
ncbi:hypothetical protein [Azospirillum sp.]|uniref:hypothetical protein n=1 Tax=Azospirillum sp. TaxID=34012 RepID=UPI002D618837|nr:hypothetical protein [Azospirillum sp.]HYF88776.1 hypothetical protein [Azospirillum sp.]